jgi:hypothetical protein
MKRFRCAFLLLLAACGPGLRAGRPVRLLRAKVAFDPSRSNVVHVRFDRRIDLVTGRRGRGGALELQEGPGGMRLVGSYFGPRILDSFGDLQAYLNGSGWGIFAYIDVEMDAKRPTVFGLP